ncbi:hypothetical protein [Nocardioides malaquae]|nr:hypothetical protein [Nocardioides malaquae]
MPGATDRGTRPDLPDGSSATSRGTCAPRARWAPTTPQMEEM